MESMQIVWWARFAISTLACWRVAELLANEDGPGDIVARLRERLGPGTLGRLMDCFQCVSVWVAAPLAFYVAGLSRDWPAVWLAISGAACILHRILPDKGATARLEFENTEGEPDNELLRGKTGKLETGGDFAATRFAGR